MKIAVCDDEPQATEILCQMLKKICTSYHTDAAIRAFNDPKEFLTYAARVHIDIVFLDIFMGSYNGMNTAHILRQFNETCNIIFVTTSADYAIEAFDVKASHYLVKPLQEDALLKALQRTSFFTPEQPKISIVSNYTNIDIIHDDIIYISVENKITTFYLKNGSIIDSRMPIHQIMQLLSDAQEFILCHRSTVINMKNILRLTETTVYMVNDTAVHISPRRYAELKRCYMTWIFAKVRHDIT